MTATGRSALLLLALTLLLGCQSTPDLLASDPAMADLEWLTGAWAGENEDGTVTEEHWTQPRAGAMFGINRTIAEGRTVFFEFLRIERTADDGLQYLAAPEGRHPPTTFRLIERSPTRFIFSNPAHDYPQRIIYEQQSDGSLILRIEGNEDGVEKSAGWSLRRANVRGGLTEYERRQLEMNEYWHYRRFYYDYYHLHPRYRYRGWY